MYSQTACTENMESKVGQAVSKTQETHSEEVSIAVFDKICRACLSSDENVYIFKVKYEEVSLYEIFKNCVAVEIEQNDSLPQNICKTCIGGLVQMHTFKLQCQRSDALLREIIKEHEQNASNPSDIKEETALENQQVFDKGKTKKKVNNVADNNISVPSLRSRRRVISKTYSNKSSVSESSDSESDIKQNQNEDDEECGLSKPQKSFRHHPKAHGGSVTSFSCKQCSESFESYSKLKLHRKHAKHPRPRNYICPECYKPFSYSHLQQHMRTHTKEKPFCCQICQMQFSLNCNLRRHMMTHTGERPHTCDVCGKGFIQATTLVEHKRTHTGETPFICSYCGMSFGRSARHKAHLRRHLIENGEFDKLMNSNECNICHRLFATKGVLKTHMLTHGEKTFLCSQCGKGFVSNAGLLSHMKVHTGVRPYPCTVCSKAFSQLGSLKSHLLIHTGQKPFICKVCSKAFTQRNHLKYHMRTHSGERPYVCSYCGKSFALNGTLTIHIRTHTGETPYICDICGRGFYDSSSMKKHKKGHGQLDGKYDAIIQPNTVSQLK